jgi:lipopolysaccharide biosynthesis regulator YciM
MAQKKPSYNVEISDIFDDDQEDLVVEKVSPFMKESSEELKEQFKVTDTVLVRRISKEDAEKLCQELEGKELSVKMYDVIQRKVAREAEKTRCPKCGTVLEVLEWRCPECYYEFPEYEFMGDDDE